MRRPGRLTVAGLADAEKGEALLRWPGAHRVETAGPGAVQLWWVSHLKLSYRPNTIPEAKAYLARLPPGAARPPAPEDIEMSIQTTAIRGPEAASRPRRAERLEARSLLSGAVEAFRAGRTAKAPPPLAGLTDSQLNDEVAAYAYGRLPQPDQAALAKIGEVRDRALALGRAGRQAEAEGTMKLARFFLSLAAFSPLGRAAADTLQQAAEAYLSYRRGDFADASARMAAAVGATDRLADAWGESRFTTGRRVHLLHNQMKVEARRGASHKAVTLGAGLLAHLVGSSAGPRLPALARPAPAMEPWIADSFCDVVAATLAEVLATVPDAEARELLAPLAGVAPGEAPSTARVWKWLPLKSAALRDDSRCFLEAAAPFLRVGRGSTPVLWYAVALDVVRVARALGAGAGSDGIVEIETVLGTEPRVPWCMQAVNKGGGQS